MKLSRLLLLLLPCAFPACAGLSVRSVSNPKTDARVSGFRYYEPATFLLVYSDGPGSVKTEVFTWLDTTRKMAVKPYSFLAKNKQTLTFTDGMLTRAEGEVDSTAVPSAMIGAIKKAAETAIKAGLLNDAPSPGSSSRYRSLEEPRLYKIVVRGDSVTLVGSSQYGDISLMQ